LFKSVVCLAVKWLGNLRWWRLVGCSNGLLL